MNVQLYLTVFTQKLNNSGKNIFSALTFSANQNQSNMKLKQISNIVGVPSLLK